MKYFQFSLALFAIALLSSSCSKVTVSNVFSYNLNCITCGTSSDGILKIEISKSVSGDKPVMLYVTNLKDEMVILDERLFVLSKNDTVEWVSIGQNNPNLTVSTSSTYSATVSASTPYLNDFLGRYYKYGAGAGTSNSTSFTYNAQPYTIIPGRINLAYPVSNYYFWQYTEFIKNPKNVKLVMNLKTERMEPDFDSLKIALKNMKSDDLVFTIVYKLLSEEKWRSASIRVQPSNFDVKRKYYKEGELIDNRVD